MYAYSTDQPIQDTTSGIGDHIIGGIIWFTSFLGGSKCKEINYCTCFETVDAKALVKLPTCVAGQFSFISPSQYGPGLLCPDVAHGGRFDVKIYIVYDICQGYQRVTVSYLNQLEH